MAYRTKSRGRKKAGGGSYGRSARGNSGTRKGGSGVRGRTVRGGAGRDIRIVIEQAAPAADQQLALRGIGVAPPAKRSRF